ncbi:MAG: hypothetical protein SGILL_008644, partial [Bacillariaceae sp.]
MASSKSKAGFTGGASSFASVDRLMEGEFTVEAADLIRIVLGFLTAQGLHESAKTLRKESGVGFDSSDAGGGGFIQKRMVAQSIRQGDWNTVFQATILMQEANEKADKSVSSRILTHITEQIILELAEEDKSLNLAYSLLKTHRDALDQIPEEESDESQKEKQAKRSKKSSQGFSKARSLELRLAAIAGNPAKYADMNARRELLYGNSRSKHDRREALAKIVDVKRDIPLNRLPTLIQQAMKWQSHTGQLPWIKEV